MLALHRTCPRQSSFALRKRTF